MKAKILFFSSLLLLLVEVSPSRAELPPGTADQPIVLDAFPFAHAGNTFGKPRLIEKYDCAPDLLEGGGEFFYRFKTEARGRLFVYLQGDTSGVDVDIQLLSRMEVSGGVAAGCLARANAYFEKDIEPGEYFLVVDSYTSSGAALEGPFVLKVDFGPLDQWRERQIAQGVIWRQKVYSDLFGGVQTANLLVVDLAQPGVTVKPVAATGCERTSAMGKRTAAVAGINGGFFSSSCAAVSLLKIDGRLLATNAVTRTSLGLDPQGRPAILQVEAGKDWPGMPNALGGGPNLVSDSGGQGVVDVTDEGFPWVDQRHPRTAVGITASDKLLMVTMDGRTEHGLGVDLYQLAQYFLWLEARAALNFDGGGSTTMYVAGANPTGVVNYPSDAAGERAVASGLFVYAPRFNHPPRFITQPPLFARAGQEWFYDADALDLDVEEALVFSLQTAPQGMTVDASTCVCRWISATGGIFPVRLAVSDGQNVTVQEFSVSVEGPDGGQLDGAEDGGGEDGEEEIEGATGQDDENPFAEDGSLPEDAIVSEGVQKEPDMPTGDEHGQVAGNCNCGPSANGFPWLSLIFFRKKLLAFR